MCCFSVGQLLVIAGSRNKNRGHICIDLFFHLVVKRKGVWNRSDIGLEGSVDCGKFDSGGGMLLGSSGDEWQQS